MNKALRIIIWSVAFALALLLTFATAGALGQTAAVSKYDVLSAPTAPVTVAAMKSWTPEMAAEVQAQQSGTAPTPTPPPAAAAPKPLSDADALQVRNLQLRATGARLAIAEASQRFQDAQRELEAATGEIQKLFTDLQRRYQCLDCDLDRNLAWQPKAQAQAQIPPASPAVESPKPAPATNSSTDPKPNPQVEKKKQ